MARRNQAGDVRHVDKQVRADAVCDFPEARPVGYLGIGRKTGHDHLRFVRRRQRLHLVVVDQTGVSVQPVLDCIEQFAGEIDLGAMGQVPAICETHAQNRVARRNQCKVGGRIGL